MNDKSPEQSPVDILSDTELDSNVFDLSNLSGLSDNLKNKRIGPEMRNKIIDKTFK